jgi:hypothetical protein
MYVTDTKGVDIGIPRFDPQTMDSYLKLKPWLDAFQNAGVPEEQSVGFLPSVPLAKG